MEDAAVAMYNAIENNPYANQIFHSYMAHQVDQLGNPWPSVAGL